MLAASFCKWASASTENSAGIAASQVLPLRVSHGHPRSRRRAVFLNVPRGAFFQGAVLMEPAQEAEYRQGRILGVQLLGAGNEFSSGSDGDEVPRKKEWGIPKGLGSETRSHSLPLSPGASNQ